MFNTMEIYYAMARTAGFVTVGVLLGVLLLPPSEGRGVNGAAVVNGADDGRYGNEMPMGMSACTCPTYHPQNHICQIADVGKS